MNDCKLCRLPSPLFYARRRAHARKFCSSDKKKKPAGGKARNPRPATLMKQHYILSTMTRAAGEPATKHRRARITIAKCILYPIFSLFPPKKCTFFQKNAKISLQYSDFQSIMPLHPKEGAKPKPKERK